MTVNPVPALVITNHCIASPNFNTAFIFGVNEPYLIISEAHSGTYFDFAVGQEAPHWLCTSLQLGCKCCIVCLRLEFHMLIQLPLIQIHSWRKHTKQSHLVKRDTESDGHIAECFLCCHVTDSYLKEMQGYIYRKNKANVAAELVRNVMVTPVTTTAARRYSSPLCYF